MTDHQQTMGVIVRDIKAIDQDGPEEEQALKVIQALLNTKHCQTFSLIMAHNENIKTFKAISQHLKMEDERQKVLAPFGVAFVGNDNKPKGKRPFRGKQAKKGPRAP